MPVWKNLGYSGWVIEHGTKAKPTLLYREARVSSCFNKSKEGSGSQTILPSPEQLKGAILPITSFLNNHNSP